MQLLHKIQSLLKKQNKITVTAIAVALFALITFCVHVIYMRTKGDILNKISFSDSYSARNGELLEVFLTPDDKYRIYKPLKEFPSAFIEALLLQEDRFYYTHGAVNPVALIKAFNQTYIKRSRRMGASTITMQVAKLKYRLYTKSVWGKLRQIFKAVYLELCFSKDQILEAYVNLVPCGSNIEGFEAASWYYFNKGIQNLNLSENIMLCVLPQNPTKRSPTARSTPSELIAARKLLFSEWVKKHPEDSDKEIFMDMQMATVCHFPNRCRHYTEMLAKNTYSNCVEVPKSRKTIRTSIDINLQNQIEELFKDHLNQNRHFGVTNGAVLLLDWKKMEVLANIGSADYYNDLIEGQVNATISKRSPGSTLKPFIYTMAVQQGIIHYRTMLKDTPVTFNEYSPDNYGSVFKGPVEAWFALADSRNIPAIALEQKLKGIDLYDFMKLSGVTQMKEREHYGLSIVLGTCEVTMLELAKMYGTLANNGVMHDINLVPVSKLNKGEQVLDPDSCFIVKKMLEDNIPVFQTKPKSVENIPIGYKTGTSIGFKDSWSVGIFDRYILIVWVGNFDGQGNNAFLGRRMSSPLMFNIAYALLDSTPDTDLLLPEGPPKDAVEIDVCEVSGGLPTDNCLRTKKAWFIPGVSPIEKCKIHRKINIDTRTGYRTDETDKPYIKSIIREFWPSDLMSLFEQAGLPRLVPPEYPPDDFKFDYNKTGYPPEIRSPMNGIDYVFRKSSPERNKILLNAVCDADTQELVWFDGPNYIGRTTPGKNIEWKPKPGKYQITVTDQKGRSDFVSFNVVEVE